MSITKSAKKALRQSIRRHARNLIRKDAYKNAVKTARNLASAGKKAAEALPALSTLYKALDKAAKTRVITRNKASRLKSRITKLFKK